VRGWLEGYLPHRAAWIFNCYEAFIHIVDSMFNQHAKWLKVTSHLPWRRRSFVELPAGLACLAQDHTVSPSGSRLHRPRREQKARSYASTSARRQLPALDDGPLAAQPPLRNVVIAGNTRRAMADDGCSGQALHRGRRHLSWASNDEGVDPDVVMACCGDVQLETLARSHPRASICRSENPGGQRRRPHEAGAPTSIRTVERRRFRPGSSRRTDRSSSAFHATRG